MAIDPNNVDTVTVPELDTAALALTNLFAHSAPNGQLNKATIQALVDFISPYISALGASEYINITDTALPDPVTDNNWSILAGGTYTQTGEADLVLTGDLNIVFWNGTTWAITKEITVNLSGYATELQISNYNNDITSIRTDGKYINDAGDEVTWAPASYVVYNLSDHPSKKVRITTSFVGSAIWGLIYLDVDGDVVGKEEQGSGSPKILTNYIGTIPDLATQVIVNGDNGVPIIVEPFEVIPLASQQELSETNDKLTYYDNAEFTETYNAYVNTDGTIASGGITDQYKYVKFTIPESRAIKVTSVVFGPVVALAIYTDIRDQFISYQNIGNGTNKDFYSDFDLTIPSNAYYVYINSRIDGQILIKTLGLKQGQVRSGLYNGKRMLITGDSFVQQATYPNKLASLLGVGEMINAGIGGRGIAQKTPGDNCIANNVGAFGYDFDVINILAVSNDVFGNVPIGNPYILDGDGNETDDLDYNINTVCGALNFIYADWFEKMKPNVKILFTIPTQTYRVFTAFAYYDAILKVSRIWGVPVNDLSATGGINGKNVLTKTRPDAGQTQGDAIHPIDAIYIRMAENSDFYFRNIMY